MGRSHAYSRAISSRSVASVQSTYWYSGGGWSAAHAPGTSAHLAGRSAVLYIWWMILGTTWGELPAATLCGRGSHRSACSRAARTQHNSKCSTSSNAAATKAHARMRRLLRKDRGHREPPSREARWSFGQSASLGSDCEDTRSPRFRCVVARREAAPSMNTTCSGEGGTGSMTNCASAASNTAATRCRNSRRSCRLHVNMHLRARRRGHLPN